MLLGWQVGDRLFDSDDPIDKLVRIAGINFRVIGVSAKKGSAFGNSLDEFVVIPLGIVSRSSLAHGNHSR